MEELGQGLIAILFLGTLLGILTWICCCAIEIIRSKFRDFRMNQARLRETFRATALQESAGLPSQVQPSALPEVTFRATALQESAGPPSQVPPSAPPEVELQVQDERERLVRACLFRRRLEHEASVAEIQSILAAARALPSPAESSSTPAEPPPPSTPECSICLVPYRAGETICWSKTNECDHIFHLKCIEQWMIQNENDRCPLCRADLMLFHSVP